VTFKYTIENAETGQRLVSAQTTLASVNPEGKLVSMPEKLRKSLEAAIA
jgi:acyl-CoA thioesterase FadM